MGYYTRVFTTAESCIALSILTSALVENGSDATIESVDDAENWEHLTLKDAGGCEIALIERNIVEGESLGRAELQEFEDELEYVYPKSSCAWLKQFFQRVQCIYTFQHLKGSHGESGFAALQTVRSAIWANSPAIIQADGEGFTNEDGYHITWEFSDSVTGEWWMGLLCKDKWVHFQMDLGNAEHRTAFKNSIVPKGVKFA